MKGILLLLLFICGITQAQIVNIPDANFKNALVSRNCVDSNADNIYDSDADTNNDGEIQITEAHAVISLNLYYANISDLTGINDFINLVKLNCWENNLTTLSISNLNSLTSLDFRGNLTLTTLNLSNLNSLTNLNCTGTSLGTLDVTGLSNLRVLECANSQLTGVNITNLSNLENLNLFDNQLSSIDFTGATNLKTIQCSYNQLSNLNVSSLVVLQTLYCSDNLLTNLNLSNNGALTRLYCPNNVLTSINVNGLSNLDDLNFDGNQMSNISLLGLTSLRALSCNDNQFVSLNLAGLTSLENLNCANNQLTNLDFSGLVNLQGVGCSNNLLQELDFSGNPVFEDLSCSNNNIRYINLKNGFNHVNVDNLWANNNLTAFSVCIDEGDRAVVDWIISQSNLNYAVLTTYCSFTPGGNYNTITGNILFDANNNGCDASDLPQPFIKVKINDGTTEGASFANQNAAYVFYTQAGNFTVTPDVENPTFFNFSPVNAVINFPDNNNNVVTQNFCVTANGVHPDLEVVIAPTILARPGFDAYYKIVYKNKGNQLLSGNLVLNFNDAVLDLISSVPMPDSQTTGQFIFNFTNLLPFENREIVIGFNVNSPLETPPVNSGDILDFTVVVNPTLGDETPIDNQFTYNQTVVNACDPNDKYCLEGEIESPVKIGDYLHYIINFENIGTADAVNVVVKDVIDTTKFDEKSLQVMNSSHPVEAKINGNVAEFIFQNINLAHNGNGGGGGHGNILLKIKTKTNLQPGDVVTNKADIFFDYNAPIETNLASTIFQTLGIQDNAMDASVSVYPNPAKDIVKIESDYTVNSIQLFDVQGRLLLSRINSEKMERVDLTSRSSGIYFIKITTGKGIKIEKILKL